jgi:hypothetical protein
MPPRRLLAAPLLASSLSILLHTIVAQQPAGYLYLKNTDTTPCVPPCWRSGDPEPCGYSTPKAVCNVTYLAEVCSSSCGCVAFNSNGWMKGCGNVSCGTTFESTSAADTYVNISSGGMPGPPTPDIPVTPIDDDFYPAEEPSQAAQFGVAPSVVAAAASGPSGTDGWAVLAPPAGTPGAPTNVTVGGGAFGVVLVAVLASPAPGSSSGDVVAVLERTFARWGYLSFVAPGSAAGPGEVARLRKGVGSPFNLTMPNYTYIGVDDCDFWAKTAAVQDDYLGQRILGDTANQPTYLAAAKYMPPQRDYANIGGNLPYQKYSVAPDGRIKIADSDIWTTDNLANETGPGVLVFDPLVHLPYWPATNWTFTKSALVGSYIRVVATIGFEASSGKGFEQVAFSPASVPVPSAYVRLRATSGPDAGPLSYAYYTAVYNSTKSTVTVDPLDPALFYTALYAEQSLWNASFAGATTFTLPGQEGHRQIDLARGSLVASFSVFIGLVPKCVPPSPASLAAV